MKRIRITMDFDVVDTSNDNTSGVHITRPELMFSYDMDSGHTEQSAILHALAMHRCMMALMYAMDGIDDDMKQHMPNPNTFVEKLSEEMVRQAYNLVILGTGEDAPSSPFERLLQGDCRED